MAECKWMKDEICVNADCPKCCDYCPVPYTANVCRHEDREDGDNDNPDKSKAFGHDAIEIMTEVQYAPTADVVEVVRCKDCKYWHEETGWCYKHSHFIKYGENGVAFCHPWESADWKMFDADYFCKDGERRDNNAAD